MQRNILACCNALFCPPLLKALKYQVSFSLTLKVFNPKLLLCISFLASIERFQTLKHPAQTCLFMASSCKVETKMDHNYPLLDLLNKHFLPGNTSLDQSGTHVTTNRQRTNYCSFLGPNRHFLGNAVAELLHSDRRLKFHS